MATVGFADDIYESIQVIRGKMNINIKGDKRIGWYDGDKNSKYERFTMFINNSDILYLERVNDKYRSYYIKVEDDLEDDFEEINVSLSDEDIKKYLEFGSKERYLVMVFL